MNDIVNKFDLNLIVALGTRGDTEINNVIKNLSIYPNQDNYALYPFGTAKEKSVEDLRKEPQITIDKIISEVNKADLSNYIDVKSLKISFIGHRGNLKPQNIDCFGVIVASDVPKLQAEIINEVKSKLPHLDKVQCKYYVCNALNKINDLLPEFKKFTPTDLNVSIKASANEIIPNPVFLNIKTGLKPEYNNKQNKLEKSLPQEYQIPQKTLKELESLNKRVLAREIPQGFQASNLRTTENLKDMNNKFQEKENKWTTYRLQ